MDAGWPAGANSVWQSVSKKLKVEKAVHNEVENWQRPCRQISASQQAIDIETTPADAEIRNY